MPSEHVQSVQGLERLSMSGLARASPSLSCQGSQPGDVEAPGDGVPKDVQLVRCQTIGVSSWLLALLSFHYTKYFLRAATT